MLMHGQSTKLIVAQLVYGAERLKNTIFWYVTPCSLVKVQRRLGRICLVHLQARRESRKRESAFLFLVSCSAYSSTQIMDVVRSSETSVIIHRITWRDVPEDNTLHCHLCENLKSKSPQVR